MKTGNFLEGRVADPAAELLDRSGALARLGGSARLLAEAAGMFLEDCPCWQADLDTYLRQGDAQRLYFTAHLLRGSLGVLGAQPAGEAARRLEVTARAGDLEAAGEALAALTTALSRLKPILASLAAARGLTHHPN